MKNIWVGFFFLQATLGWMSMLELAEGSSAMSTGSPRFTRSSVRACKRSQQIRLPTTFRVCQNRIPDLLKLYCASIGEDSVVAPESPNHSNIVDACCNNCCTVQQFQHYCKEFRSTTPEPIPPQQEPISDTMRLVVGILSRLILPRVESQSEVISADGSQTLQAWDQHRPHQQKPTESQLQVGGESSGPTESGYILYR